MSHEQPNFEITPSPKRKTAAGVTVVLCLLAGNFYLYSRVNRAEVDAHTLRQTLEEKLARVEKKSTFHLNNTQREIEDLRESLDQARSQASKTAKSEARRQTDKLGKNIAARQRSAKEAVMSEMRTVGDKAFEVEILADDKTMVKKGQYANEPVEFYVAHRSEPYEVVMTAVKKDHVMGFLSRPKDADVRR